MSARPVPAIALTSEAPVTAGQPGPGDLLAPDHRGGPTDGRHHGPLPRPARCVRPAATVLAVDLTLRQFAGCVTATDPTCRTMAQVTRGHFEDYKGWLARRPGRRGALSATTISGRLGLLRTFFERIIDWGYDDAPARVPIFAGDFPNRDEPLPKFLDDPTAAKFMAGLATDPNPRRRLMVEILARTGSDRGNHPGSTTTRDSCSVMVTSRPDGT